MSWNVTRYAGSSSTESDTHDIPLIGVEEGDKVIILACGPYGNRDWPEGWTVHFNDALWGTNGWISVIERDMTDDEDDSVRVELEYEQQLVYIVYVLQGHAGTPIAVSTGVEATTQQPNPDSLTPSWGAKETLWIAAALSIEPEIEWLGYPPNYTAGINHRKTGFGSSLSMAAAHRILTAASEDPGPFQLDTWTTDRTFALTIAVEPVEAAIARLLASVAEVEPDAAALVRPTRRVQASIESEPDADVEAAIARVLASVAQVDPDVVPVLRPARLAAACVQAEADVLGELAVEKIIRLAAVLEAEGSVTGGLRVARELAAVVDAEVVADAAPEVRRLLAAQLAADADAAARLHVARALAAALEADVDASAALFLATLLLTTLSVHVVGAGRSAMASEVAGPALARVVQGPALSREGLGPAVRRFDIEGPAAS